jgi:uncharacterized membrane protein YebE (DUF533 family)
MPQVQTEVNDVIDAQRLLEQVFGSTAAGNARNTGRDLMDRLDATKGSKAFAGGAVAGGLLGLLLGGKSRRRGGGLLGYGGAAALGALALQAYQSYQRQQGGGAPGLDDFGAAALPHARPATDGSPFELVLVRAMVGAAKADGHIDAAEQRRLFAEVERLGLDADAKAYVFDLLTHDVDLDGLARAAGTPEQGAEVYLAARLAIDPDQPAERAYLDALAARLKLPAELRATLDGTALPSSP